MRYAILGEPDAAGVKPVLNVIEWDGESEWSPPEGATVVRDDALESEPRGTYDGSTFTKPPSSPPQPEPKTFEQLVSEASSFEE